MKKIIKILYFFLMIGTILFISNGSKDNWLKTSCKSLEINVDVREDLFFLNAEKVKAFILDKEDSLLGKSYEDINIYLLEEFVNTHPMIKKAELYLGNTGRLYVNVKQCHPLFRIFEGDTSYYLDDEFLSFPLSDYYSARVAHVYWSQKTDSRIEILKKLEVFMQEDGFVNSIITGVQFDENDELIIYPRVGMHKIILGSLFDIEDKFQRLKLFYELGIKKVGWDRYSIINLKYDDQIVCTKR